MAVGLGDLVALACAVFWAATSLLARALSRSVPPLWYNTLRCLVGALIVIALLPWTATHSDLSVVTPMAVLLLLGSVVVGMGIGDTAFFEALKRIGVARAMPIGGSYPLLTALLAVPTLGETITPTLVGGMLIVGAGVWLLTGDRSNAGSTRRAGDFTFGLLLAGLAALCWAGSAIFVRPALQTIDVVLATTIRMPAAALMLLLAGQARLGHTPPPVLSRSTVPWLVVAGVGTTFSATLFLWAVDLVGAARTAALTSASPLFAAPLAIWLLGETPSIRLFLGIALTTAGLILLMVG